jgi:hypothetical protein
MNRRSILRTSTLLVILTLTTFAQETAGQKYLLAVERIWDRAPHSAFTDLVDFQGRLYCTFREGTGHVPGREGNNGAIRIIVSTDGQNWRSAALITEPGVDLRDPKLSVTPDGRLMVLMGGSFYEGEKLQRAETRVAFSDRAGAVFGTPRPVRIDQRVRTDRDWLWRVTWHQGIGYGVAYQWSPTEWKTQLLRTRNGIDYDLVTTFDITGHPNETTLRFTADGEMVAWVRRDNSNLGMIGFSRAPFTDWTWKEQDRRVGGPEFLFVPGADGEIMLGTSRGYLPERKSTTFLGRLDRQGTIDPLVTFPSGGDTSYAGMVRRGDRLLVAYYSSHEGKTAIYLATINLTPWLKPRGGKSGS